MDIAVLLDRVADWGSAGIVIVVVLLFLKHLKERDAELNAVLREMTTAFHAMVTAIRVESERQNHRRD